MSVFSSVTTKPWLGRSATYKKPPPLQPASARTGGTENCASDIIDIAADRPINRTFENMIKKGNGHKRPQSNPQQQRAEGRNNINCKKQKQADQNNSPSPSPSIIHRLQQYQLLPPPARISRSPAPNEANAIEQYQQEGEIEHHFKGTGETDRKWPPQRVRHWKCNTTKGANQLETEGGRNKQQQYQTTVGNFFTANNNTEQTQALLVKGCARYMDICLYPWIQYHEQAGGNECRTGVEYQPPTRTSQQRAAHRQRSASSGTSMTAEPQHVTHFVVTPNY